MKTRQVSTLRPQSLRLKTLENRALLSAADAALGYNYKVLATNPSAENRQSVAYARLHSLDAPTNATRSVDANFSAENFVVQSYRNELLYKIWIDVPQPAIAANGDETFTMRRPNGAN